MPVNLERLDRLCKGDLQKKQKYLQQFLELVPPKASEVLAGLRANDEMLVRQSVHFLAPHLSFFGIPDFAEILEDLGAKPDQEKLRILSTRIEQAVDKAHAAATEVNDMLKNISLNPTHEN